MLLTAHSPFSYMLFKRRLFTHKIYLKGEVTTKDSILKDVLTSAGAAGAAFIVVAIMAFLGSTNWLLSF